MAGLLVPLSNTGRDEILCWWWDTTIGFPSCCFYWFCWFWLVLLFYMLLALVLSFWNISLYFVPGLLRRQKLKFVFYFSLSNIHNMFWQYALVTWYLIYNWQKRTRSHEEHTPLSLSPAISQKQMRAEYKGKNLSLWPTFPLLLRPRAPPCKVRKLLQWQHFPSSILCPPPPGQELV